jgi:hypothetical protein
MAYKLKCNFSVITFGWPYFVVNRIDVTGRTAIDVSSLPIY